MGLVEGRVKGCASRGGPRKRLPPSSHARDYGGQVASRGGEHHKGHLRKLDEKFGIAGKEMAAEANTVYAASHENLPSGGGAGIL
jgi:hypothetical protein